MNKTNASVAVLSSVSDYTTFSYGGQVIRFAAPYSLRRYVRCVVEAMHVHAGDEEMTQSKAAKFFVKADGSSVMKRKGDLTAREAKGIQAYIKKHYLAMYAKWCRKSKNGFYKGN